ncbi:hypothetical protein GCM10007366_10580 [Mammaliicoccus vitulinus]|nr:hypothetical protein GCM10007366_10580 [Mammaliicoccus vitulinus]
MQDWQNKQHRRSESCKTNQTSNIQTPIPKKACAKKDCQQVHFK